MSTASIQHYINGQMSAGASGQQQAVTNPATGQVTGQVALASQADSAPRTTSGSASRS